MLKPFKSPIVLILILAVFIRFLCLYYLKDMVPEPFELNQIAHNILEGKGMVFSFLNTTYYAYYPPLLPLFFAAIEWLTPHYLFTMGLIQIVVSAVCTYLVYRITYQIFSSLKISNLAALLFALHPGFIIYTAKASGDIFFIFLYLGLTFLMLRLDFTKTLHIVLFGMTISIAFLTRSVFIIFLPLFMITLTFQFRNSLLFLRSCALMVGIFCLTIAPWGIRNYFIFKKPLLTVTTASINLWQGNNPISTGTLYTTQGIPNMEYAKKYVDPKIFEQDELRQSFLFRQAAINYIFEKPGLFILRTLKKILYFWTVTPTAGLHYPKIWLNVYLIYYGIIILFFLFQLKRIYYLQIPANLKNVFLVLLLLLAHSALHTIYYVETRHRWAIEAFILMIAAPGIASVLSRLKCTKTTAISSTNKYNLDKK